MAIWKPIVGKSFTADAFAAYAGGLKLTAWRPRFVVLHNTGAPKLSDWHKVPGADRIRNLENYYKNVMKWSAGPHLFIADDLIWVFTPLTTPGVHSPSWNSTSWGVEMVGDYETEPFGPEGVKRNAVVALAALHHTLGVSPSTLRFHKEDPKTDHNCPGKHVDKAGMISLVEAEISARYAPAP